jgi:putative DNA primase/helicase
VWISPKLLIKSATKRAAKTLLCETIERLAPRPLLASSATAASLYREIERCGDRPPTLILDEFDNATNADDPLRKLVNSWQRKSAARVMLSTPCGDDWESRYFSTWAPIVLGGIGGQHGTVMDRSIVVQMRRKTGAQLVDRLRGDRDLGFGELSRKCARWATDHLNALADAEPTPPAGIHDRAKDNWSPLLAIAELAGGHWPTSAREAALELHAAVEELDAAELGVLVLTDIRDIFAE